MFSTNELNEKIKKHFKSIPDKNIRKKALHNIYINKSYYKHHSEYPENLADAILIGFSWNETKEGYDFWDNFHSKVY